jgi:citrate lyase gamma subunit
MSMASQICNLVREAKASDKTVHVSDFQVKVVENGAVLINLKTREAALIKADESDDFSAETDITE